MNSYTAPNRTAQRRPTRAQILIRLSVSALVVGVILSRVETRELAGLLPRVSPPAVAAAFALFLLDRVVMAWRWHRLLRTKGIRIPWLEIVRMYFVSAFLGLFMPSSVAPDLIRVYLANRHGCHWTDAVSSVFLDRFIAFVTLAGIAFGSSLAVVLMNNGFSLPVWILLLTSAPLFLCALVAALLRVDLEGPKADGNPLTRKFFRTIQDFRSSVVSYRHHFHVLKQVAALSVLNHSLYILAFQAVTMSLNIEASFLVLCSVVPLVSFLTMIPVSLAGLGIQEGALIYFLSRAGISSEEALAVAVLIRILMTLGCLPGALFYLMGGRRETGDREKSC